MFVFINETEVGVQNMIVVIGNGPGAGTGDTGATSFYPETRSEPETQKFQWFNTRVSQILACVKNRVIWFSEELRVPWCHFYQKLTCSTPCAHNTQVLKFIWGTKILSFQSPLNLWSKRLNLRGFQIWSQNSNLITFDHLFAKKKRRKLAKSCNSSVFERYFLA